MLEGGKNGKTTAKIQKSNKILQGQKELQKVYV